MKLFFVYSLTQASPKLWKFFGVDGVLVSADDLASCDGRVKEFLGFDGYVVVDSGGYRLLSRSKALDVVEVLDAQARAGADLNVALDYPLSLNPTQREFLEKVAKTIENVELWLDAFGSERVMPVLHARSPSQLEFVKDLLVERYGNVFTYLGLGSLAEVSRYSPEKMVELAAYARKLFANAKLHAFGCGNSSAVILSTLGFDSADAASHVHDARFGMVRHPQTLSMAVVAERKRVSRPRIELEELFSLCSCPVCQSREKDLASWGRKGVVLRAVHNAWWLKKMVEEKLLTPRWMKYLKRGLRG